MRLSKIKLAGFKSFVDPTMISFPSSLVGVVGPNGCGKSNVIDAVRWVMGESSATRLRGDSITDVIFNGSSTRKPIGAASVELLFDNSETTLEGQYAKYAEISIRREVSRDGASNYYLNGTRCRRKDITGVFLGTGLGPRSYSIIEQGMISRMIEAKPEEMRVFLEEAAGISKYKERRKETSSRIKRTKENLARLLDVLDEVEKQIKHLDRQAKTAERYGRYRNDERRTAADLLALRTKDFEDQEGDAGAQLAEQKTNLEAAIAKQRSLETTLEDARIRQMEKTDEFNVIQSRYYKVGSEIARLEQSIEHARELRERQQKDLEQATIGAKEIAGHIDQDEIEIEELEVTLCELVPGLEQAREREHASTVSFQQAEVALSDWQEQWDTYSKKYSDAQQAHSVEITRSEQIESRLQSLSERCRKVAESKEDSSIEPLKIKYDKISEQKLKKRQARNELDHHLTDATDDILKLRDQDRKLTHVVEERHSAMQDAKGKFASLEALQKAAMGEGEKGIKTWLKGAGLDKNHRVAHKLSVDSGWEKAVETVLGDYLQAICVADITSITEVIARLKTGNVTLLQDQLIEKESPALSSTLSEKAKGAPAEIAHILSSVLIAETLEKALKIRESLTDGASVITIDGIWLGKNWLRVSREKEGRAGVLARKEEITRLDAVIREMQARYESARKLLQDGRARLNQLEERREILQRDASSALSEYSDVKAALESARYKLDQAIARASALTEESKDLNEEKNITEKQLRESQQVRDQAATLLQQLEVEKLNHESRREELRLELQRVREQADEDRQNVQDIAIQFESRRTSKESVALNLERMKSQLSQFQTREAEIRSQLEVSQSPLTGNKDDLAALLENRLEVEEELASARRIVEAVENKLRELDQSRMQIDQSVDASRSKVSEAELTMQELKVRREGLVEQLSQTDYEYFVLLEEMDDEATVELWEEKLEKARKRIDKLGPINLAAIEEFKEQSERKEYLDSQLTDLNDALSILEGAIRKIDRETRTRFKETFDNVNAGFKVLFPKLFGGGHAYLEFTGDDLLTTGITVMARPPGKRNSTIHLLSGGEKALTAVALVFAIFELNPAPFCMLDEVDAPLDDANVTRFCNIVKEMSDKVQFVFITHNKVTMEVARQLLGVTMQEPGVSRLVTVDLDAAVKMAAS
ncbi:MAG: chromosome segregation protein SMC [Woeseiaceae bacterium]|nr:chromosome segregation protein SMC [Woeseiaceae bacterium]